MKHLNIKTSHLIPQARKWLHQPTVAIRVPAEFSEQLLEIARSLDQGKFAPIQAQGPNLENLGIDELASLQESIKLAMATAKEQTCDRSLEQAIAYLSACCDGAQKEDGQGFNGGDAGFGNWLGDLVAASKPLIQAHAKSALKMLQKYTKQLSRGGLSLPSWEQIAHQYPEKLSFAIENEEELPEKQVIVLADSIAVYAPYDATGQFQRLAKTVTGYRFNGHDKSWRFPLEQVKEVIAKFDRKTYVYDINIVGLLLSIEQQEINEKLRLETEALEKAGNIISLTNQANFSQPLANGWYLRNYQQEGVKWLLSHTKQGLLAGGILADQMGLGKTLTALVAAKAMQKKEQCAIWVICPVSLKDNWLKEAAIAEVQIEVFSWAKLPKSTTEKPYLLIADEAHYAQNFSSQRTQKLIELAQNTNCLASWLLTGTPIKNGRPINLYPLLLAINHPIASDKKLYEKHYCNASYRSVGKRSVWDTSGATHLDELSAKTEDAILRRTKEKCLPELPAKTRLMQEVALESKAFKEYNSEVQSYVQDYRDRVKLGLVDKNAEALVTLGTLRKLGSKYKVDAAIEIASQLLEEGQQVVLFTEFVDSASSLYAALGGELLTGATKPEERQAMVDRFQSGESKVFIGTIKAGGVGITLTAASTVVLVDRPWTPGDTEQAEDRCHRLGQKNAVFALWMQLGQIDLIIDNLIQIKQERIELVLKGKLKTLQFSDSLENLALEILSIL